MAIDDEALVRISNSFTNHITNYFDGKEPELDNVWLSRYGSNYVLASFKQPPKDITSEDVVDDIRNEFTYNRDAYVVLASTEDSDNVEFTDCMIFRIEKV